jgi:hypothetical protein
MNQASLIGKYVIDASAIFDFWLVTGGVTRPYHVKVNKFRSIWDHITLLVENGTILVPDTVATEVVVADPELLEWVDSHKKGFVDSDSYQIELSRVVNDFQSYTLNRLNKLNDAKLISIAMGENLAVITSEHIITGTPSPMNPKIPNVCDHFSIKWVNLPEFFAAEGL